MNFESTAETSIPKDPLEQVIGQDNAVHIAKVAGRQRRHLLMVAPPGTGKSMIAQAIAYHLPKPTEEISVLHNAANPERPVLEVRSTEEAAKEDALAQGVRGRLVEPVEVPSFVAERLGFRCRKCGSLSRASQKACPKCGFDKRFSENPFPNIYVGVEEKPERVHTTRLRDDNSEEVIVYERAGEKVRILDQSSLQALEDLKRRGPRKVLVPFDRKPFVVATGSSETELLGDVKHDPYGGHHQIGTPAYQRVVPGAIHEAHQGVLFIDELSALAGVQRYLFTAMQEKKYAISGRNPQSAGASVRVDAVPCNFILVAASNINDLPYILPPLRSRIKGNGYEVLLETVMQDTPQNREKLLQFTAQEIRKDGKIPHANPKAVEALCDEARKIAREFDGAENSLTLRFRELSGLIRLAGDIAVGKEAELIEPAFVKEAAERGKNIEQQLSEKYGSVWRASQEEAAKTRGRQKEVG
jgi:ATP-dependent Lon protease